MSSPTGPSYYDVTAYVEHLRDSYAIGVDFLLVPPLYVRATGKHTSWHVSARAWRLSDSLQTALGGQAAFGAGGAWKTLPAAQLAALRTLEEKLKERESEAERQARS